MLRQPAAGQVPGRERLPVSYPPCRGDVAENGIFAFHLFNTFWASPADITDGLGNTAALSEFIVSGNPPAPRRRTTYSPVDRLGPHWNESILVERCLSLDGMIPVEGSYEGDYRGLGWIQGGDVYDHLLTPNQNTCQAPVGSTPWGTVPANSFHPGGVQLLMADGRVQFARETIARDAWKALATRAGGEIISNVD
jgi:prepilin-type processing-associated H-X9-DG protein